MKTIINGSGTIVNDKYVPSSQDVEETKLLIKELERKVASIIRKKFGSVSKEKNIRTKYCKYINQSTAYMWTPKIFINTKNYFTNNTAFVYATTGNNSSGYGDNEFKRHFNIAFELKGAVRYKFHKKWENDSIIIKKYILADNMQEAINKFQKWIDNDYDKFFAEIRVKNLEFHR